MKQKLLIFKVSERVGKMNSVQFETVSRMKKISYIVLLFFAAIFSVVVFSYDNIVAHPLITSKALEVYTTKFGGNFTEEQKKWIESGSTDEDATPRYVNHFYNPATGKGIDDGILKGKSAKKWAFDQYGAIEGDYSVPKILENYKYGKKREAYEGIGHIAHLVQDMTVPAHTRNDSHGGGDPYEQWAKENGKVEEVTAVEIPKLTIDQTFDAAANFSHESFFSKDTIDVGMIEKAVETGNIAIKIESGIDGKPYKYFYSKTGNIEFKLVSKDAISFQSDYILDDPLVHSDYWRMLAPQAVKYTLSVFDYFQKEFDKIDAENQLKPVSKFNKFKFTVTNMDNSVAYMFGRGEVKTEIMAVKTYVVAKTAVITSALAVKNTAVVVAGAIKDAAVATAIAIKEAVVATAIAVKDFTVAVADMAAQVATVGAKFLVNSLQQSASLFSSTYNFMTGIFSLSGQGASSQLAGSFSGVFGDLKDAIPPEIAEDVEHDQGGIEESAEEPDTVSVPSTVPEQQDTAALAELYQQLTEAKAMLENLQAQAQTEATQNQTASNIIPQLQAAAASVSSGVGQQAIVYAPYGGFGGGVSTADNQSPLIDSQADQSQGESSLVPDGQIENEQGNNSDDTGNLGNSVGDTDIVDNSPLDISLSVEECFGMTDTGECLSATTDLFFSWSSEADDLAYFNTDVNGFFGTTTATSTFVIGGDGDIVYFSATAVGLAGNTSATSTIAVKISLPPQPPIILSPSIFPFNSSSTQIVFSGTAQASSTISAVYFFNSTTTTTEVLADSDGDWSFSLDFEQGEAVVQFFAINQDGAFSEPVDATVFVDSAPPEISRASIGKCLSESSSCDIAVGYFSKETPLEVRWSRGSNSNDIDYYEISDPLGFIATTSEIFFQYSFDWYGWKFELPRLNTNAYSSNIFTRARLATLMWSNKYDGSPDPVAVKLSLRAKDLSGNWSETQIIESNVYIMPIGINEVAWAGTEASSSDEWIELYNRSDIDINLDGWILRSFDNDTYINLTGVLGAGKYFIIESNYGDRTSSEIFSNQNEPLADMLVSFGHGLSNDGELLFLERSAADDFGVTEVDRTALKDNGKWPGGNTSSNKTMEKEDIRCPGSFINNWKSNNGNFMVGHDKAGNPIRGTPKMQNSLKYSSPV